MLKAILRIDLLIFLPALLLTFFGLLMIFSVTFESDPSIFYRQLFYAFFAVILFLTISTLDFKNLARFNLFFYASLILLLLTTFIIGIEVRGSARWIDLGFVTIQASEFAKPVLVLSLASFLADAKSLNVKNLLISLALVAIPAFIVFKQPDFGNSFILLSVWPFLIFIAGLNYFYFIAGALGLVIASPFVWNLLKDYQKQRITSFLNPNLDPQGASYNIVQALIAFGSGELTGRGLGRGTQSHLNFLPAQRTDFIFSAAGEELGFLGISILISIYAFLVFRLVKVAQESKDWEASLLIYGVAFIIFMQFVVNSAVNVGFMPVTGVTLPFVSFGGSSLVSMFLLLALVQIAKRIK